MNPRLLLILFVTAFLAVFTIVGTIPLPLSAAIFVIISASLCDVRAHRTVLSACPNAFNRLYVATEFLGDEIHNIPSPATPFYNLIERGIFEKHTGTEHTTFNVGRMEPTSRSAGWSDITGAGGAGAAITGAACADDFLEIGVGFNTRTFHPRKLQLKGPSICRDQLTFAHRPMDFIKGHYVPGLANYTKRKIDLEFRDQTMKLGVKTSIVANAFNTAGAVVTGLTNPTVNPTSQITWDYLDRIAANLIRAGATNPDGTTIELGPFGPIFDIYMGLEMIAALFANVPAIYANFQYADMGRGNDARTLLAVGQSVAVKNWRFHPVTHPPRADFVGGIIVEREAFEDVAATAGTESVETSLYINADLEAAIQPHIKQWSANVVSPDDAGLDFDGTSWTGEWKFVTGGSRISVGSVCYDPLHKWGAHFAEYVYAPEPTHTNFSNTMWFRRCQNNQRTAGCGSSGA